MLQKLSGRAYLTPLPHERPMSAEDSGPLLKTSRSHLLCSTSIMPSRLLSIMAVAHLLTVVPVVEAQSSTVQCLSQYDWVGHKTTSAVIDLPVFGQMNNSLSQTPCVVAAYAMTPCSGGSKIIVS